MNAFENKQVLEYAVKSGIKKEIIDKLIGVFERTAPEFQFAVKWNQITVTKADHWHHWLFGIQTTKKAVNLVFHFGSLLRDRKNLLQGTGKYLRQIKFTSPGEIEEEGIVELIHDAMDKHGQFIAQVPR